MASSLQGRQLGWRYWKLLRERSEFFVANYLITTNCNIEVLDSVFDPQKSVLIRFRKQIPKHNIYVS